jgi:hypothetical protein
MDRRKVFPPVEGFSIIKGGALVHPWQIMVSDLAGSTGEFSEASQYYMKSTKRVHSDLTFSFSEELLWCLHVWANYYYLFL